MGRQTISDRELDSSELREAAISGVRWFGAAKVASEVLQLVAAIALARLIGPAAFGNAAVAMIVLPLAVILTYEGFGSALVQRKLITDGHYEAATLTSVVSGFALSLATFLLAPIVAAPIFGDEIAGLVQLVSPAFAIAGIGAVSRAHLLRRLDFRTSSLIETASLVVGSFAAVGFAAAGLGAEALVLGGLTTTALASLLLVLAAPPSRPRWRSQELAEISRFGSPAAAAGVLYVAISNVDYAVLAARLSATQVGIYWRAFQLGVLYQDKLSGVMMRLAFPLYSRTSDLNEMKRLHERATRVHGAVVVPLLAILIVTAPELVPLVFGDAWRAAVEPTQILAVAGMIAAILTGYPQLMLAAGRPRPLMIFNCCVLVVYGLAVFATASLGLATVAVAVVVVHVAMLAAVYLILFRRVLGMPIGRLVGDLAPAVVGSAAIVAVGLPLAALLRELSFPSPLLIVVAGSTGLLVQALTLRTCFPAVWTDISSLIRRVLPALASSGPDPTLIG
ncbi:MAG TPA: oligosaccharide flippase family protein [Solirubrobacterales bacterium]|jgi:O-antigen/teichoic acid export membrane protein|nr:oligosaccharide flippase family protein [Solirubrobacterales bacterium]